MHAQWQSLISSTIMSTIAVFIMEEILIFNGVRMSIHGCGHLT
jgi:hypothetical protein